MDTAPGITTVSVDGGMGFIAHRGFTITGIIVIGTMGRCSDPTIIENTAITDTAGALRAGTIAPMKTGTVGIIVTGRGARRIVTDAGSSWCPCMHALRFSLPGGRRVTAPGRWVSFGQAPRHDL